MCRRVSCCALCVALLWLSASPCLAAEAPLTEAEQREILADLQELQLLRQENARLREVVAKGIEAIRSLQAENDALRHAQESADRVILAQEKLAEIQERAMKAYKELAVAESLRADREKERREAAEKWTVAGWIGTAVGLAAIVGSILAK